MAADAVMPTLDAVTADLYRRINRPHPEVTFERMVEGTAAFGAEYRGKLWPEALTDAVVGIITRHRMSGKDLLETLERWSPGRVKEALADLKASGRAQVVPRYGVRFWSAAPSHYPGEREPGRRPPRAPASLPPGRGRGPLVIILFLLLLAVLLVPAN